MSDAARNMDYELSTANSTRGVEIREVGEVTERLSKVDAVIAELHDEVSKLGSAIGPVLTPVDQTVAEGKLAEISNMSEVAIRLRSHCDEIASAISQLRHMRQRVEL